MTLTKPELILLEDCEEDWRGLWEAVWMEPDEPVEQRAALVTALIERGLLEVLRINEWKEARDAAALPREDALAVVRDVESYAAPHEGHQGYFHVLSITAEGLAARHASYG